MQQRSVVKPYCIFDEDGRLDKPFRIIRRKSGNSNRLPAISLDKSRIVGGGIDANGRFIDDAH